MKTIIAGSRTITDPKIVYDVLSNYGGEITEVVCGGAKGVDSIGEQWAKEHNIPVTKFLPNWTKYGKGAGHVRNAEMALYADALIAIWDGHSFGTANMINVARASDLKIHVEMLDG